MTPLEHYRACCEATDTARAAEQAALQAARESGCTLQQLADVRGRTRAGISWLLKQQRGVPAAT